LTCCQYGKKPGGLRSVKLAKQSTATFGLYPRISSILQKHGMKKQSLFAYSFAALFALLSGIYGLFYTATGLSWYLNQSISDSGATISIEKLNHNLNGDYTLAGLKYVTPRFRMEISKLELSWNPLKILQQEVDIRSLAGESLSLHWNSENLGSGKAFQLPLMIKISSGSIRNLSVTFSDVFQESFHHVKLEQVYLYDNFFTNKIIFTTDNGGAFEISGKAGLRNNDVINLTTKTTFAIPNTSKVISGQGTIVGTLSQLRFLQHIKTPYASSLTGTINNLLVNPRLDFNFKLHSLSGEVLGPYFNVNLMQGELTGNGTLSTIQMRGDLKLKDDNAKWWTVSLNAAIDQEKADFSIETEKTNKNHLVLQGQWQYRSDRSLPRSVTVSGTVANLSWPLQDKSAIKVRQGNFHYDGTTLNSEVNLTELNVESIGTQLTALELHTRPGESDRVQMSGKASSGGGSLNFSGELDKAVLGYQLANLTVSGQNFALVRKPKAHIIISPELTVSRNNRDFQSSGVIKVPTANIQLQDFSETYDQLVSLFGNATKASVGATQSVKQLNLEFGKSVWLHGYGLNANVTGDLEIENMSNKKLIANGSLNVLRGNYTNQNRKFMVSGGLLKFDNKQLDNPDLEIRVVDKHASRNTAIIKGPLQTLHTAQDKAPEELSQEKLNRVALND
jgi:hypothetical protein